MTKMQRVLATLKKEETDRVPFSAYLHSTVHERTPEKFARFTLDFYNKYDPDYVKVMYDDLYDTPVNFFHVLNIEVWKLFERFDPHIGAFGRQIQSLKRIKDAVGADVPVIQTVLSPVYIAYRLAGRRILEDWKKDREAVSHAVDTIAANYVSFAESCVKEAGIDGFFYGAFGCEKGWMSEAQFKEMVMPSDLEVLKTLSKSPICIVHVHSEKDSYFDLLIDYPCNAISWEDRQAGPPVAEAKKRTDKCLVGGVDHYLALKCSPKDIVTQGQEAIQAAGGRGLVLAPGCTFFYGTPEANMLALKEAVGA
jgi:uroporphyrinogen decarboxylase